jgi:3'-phosphoadenosine 5'-phosphosulfate synthase
MMIAYTSYGAFTGIPSPLTPTFDTGTHKDFINNHPLVKKLRSQAEFSESSPYSEVSESQVQNLISGTLIGPGKIEAAPFAWTEASGKSYIQICYIGSRLCGYPGYIHGGLLATMLDECFVRCCSAAVPHTGMMTANLNVDFKVPTQEEQYIVLRVKISELEGKKAWLKGQIETLVLVSLVKRCTRAISNTRRR